MQLQPAKKKRMSLGGLLRRMGLGIAVVGAFLNPTSYNLLSVTIAYGASQPLVVVALWIVWLIAAGWFYRLVRRRLGVPIALLLVAAVGAGFYVLNLQTGLFDVFSFGFWRWLAPILGGVVAAIVLSSGGRRDAGEDADAAPARESLEPPDFPRLTR